MCINFALQDKHAGSPSAELEMSMHIEEQNNEDTQPNPSEGQPKWGEII